MRQFRVERWKGGYGIFRDLEIVVDGESVASLRQGQSIELEVSEEGREIWGKMDWAETDRLNLGECASGQVIVFKGYFTWDLLKGVGISEMPFDVFAAPSGTGKARSGENGN